jgi:hypothetical protein
MPLNVIWVIGISYLLFSDFIVHICYKLPYKNAGATFDWTFFDNSKVIDFDD